MKKYIFYIIYDVVYQIISFWILLYVGIFFNPEFIPDSLMWKNNKPRTDLAGAGGATIIDSLILIVEASILILFIYFINKLILSDTEEKVRRNAIANRTAKINMILFACFIGILIYGMIKDIQ